MASATNKLIWAVMVVSLVIYVVVAYLVDRPPNPDSRVATMAPILAVFSIGIAIGTVLYRRRALVRPIRSGTLDPSSPEGREMAFPAFILNLVLCESVGIYGLVLSFLSGQPLYAVGFCAAGIALMLFHRPTAPDLQRARPLHDHSDSTPIR